MNTAQIAPSGEYDEQACRGHVLKDMLKAERWSARKVALKIGLSHNSVSNRFHGTSDLTFTDIERIAELLNMTPEALVKALRDGADTCRLTVGCSARLSYRGSLGEPDKANTMAEVLPLHPRSMPTVEHEELAPVTAMRKRPAPVEHARIG